MRTLWRTRILLRVGMLKKPSGTPQPRALKHVPERTCIACRDVKPKRDLVRLVYASNGAVEVDASGRKPGRGVYLCQSPECWHKGVTKGKLEHALRGRITPENRALLVKLGTTIRRRDEAESTPKGEAC